MRDLYLRWNLLLVTGAVSLTLGPSIVSLGRDLGLAVWQFIAAEQRQQDRQEEEAVRPAPQSHQEEHLEENAENVRGREGQRNTGEEKSEEGVPHARSDTPQRVQNALFTRAGCMVERMRDVRRVIYRQTDGDKDVHSRNARDGDAEVIAEAQDVDNRHDDTEDCHGR